MFITIRCDAQEADDRLRTEVEATIEEALQHLPAALSAQLVVRIRGPVYGSGGSVRVVVHGNSPAGEIRARGHGETLKDALLALKHSLEHSAVRTLRATRSVGRPAPAQTPAAGATLRSSGRQRGTTAAYTRRPHAER